MEEIINRPSNAREVKNTSALYNTAKHFDILLRHNGASWRERLAFAKEFFEGNGIFIPDFAINLEVKSPEDVIREYIEKNITVPKTCKDAHKEYIDWCKTYGYEPVFKQRFIEIAREVALVKDFRGNRNTIFGLIDMDKLIDETHGCPSILPDVKKFIIEVLDKQGEMHVNSLYACASKANISKASFDRAKSELAKEGVISYRRISEGKGAGVEWFISLAKESEE